MKLSEDNKCYYSEIIEKLYKVLGLDKAIKTKPIGYSDTLEKVYRYIENLNVNDLDLELKLVLTYKYKEDGKIKEGKKLKNLDREFRQKDILEDGYTMFDLPENVTDINIALKPTCRVNENILKNKPDLLNFDVKLVDEREDYDGNILKQRDRVLKTANGKYIVNVSKRFLWNYSYLYNVDYGVTDENTL